MKAMRARNAARCVMILGAACMVAACAWSADLPKPAIPGRVMLPQEHPYQRQLRAYMATLTEKDFTHGVTGKLTESAADSDADHQYRNFLFTQMAGGAPLVGSKRGAPAVNNPASLYLLSSIERATAIELPLGYPESLMTFVQWDYPGNVYHNNRALKMRCFINASVNLMMLDEYLEKEPSARRADLRAYQLIVIGAPYAGFRDLLPPEVRRAYQEGVKKLARQLLAWGPRGEDTKLDLMLPIGLWYACQVCDDPALSKDVEAFARGMFTDPRFLHPAGYWIERGGPDTGFGGHSNVFVGAAALATDWPFANEALEKVYRLRSHLILPEPDGTITGPSAYNTRYSSPAHADQWEMGVRNRSAQMVTDEALCTSRLPAPEVLAAAAARRAAEYNRQIAENPMRMVDGKWVYWRSEDLPPQPWKASTFPNWQFPLTMNFGYEFYKKGTYARLAKLDKESSPLLKYPMQRGETFVRDFAKAFVVARMPEYGVILHTGPVGRQTPDNGMSQMSTAPGLGGGQLSAFWTPATGSVILARRGGMVGSTPHDHLDQWRTWPIHAVSGVTAEGKVFTSARIATPDTKVDAQTNSGTAKVRGPLTAMRVVVNPMWGRSCSRNYAAYGKNRICNLGFRVVRVIAIGTAAQGAGTMTDAEMAARTGRGVWAVWQRRRKVELEQALASSDL